MNPIIYYDNTRRLMFGKYQGEPVWDIIKKDPQYISWCTDNIDNFKLSEKEISYCNNCLRKISYEISRMPGWYKRKYGYWRNWQRRGWEYNGGGYGCGDRNLYG